MTRFSRTCWAGVFTCIGFTSSLHATIIDFESFAPFQIISNIDLGGVRLHDTRNIGIVIYDNVYGSGYHSPTKAFSSPSFCQYESIVGVFDVPQDFVRLWGGNIGDQGSGGIWGWNLEVFDAPVAGNSLGIVTMGTWSGSPYTSLELAVPGIRRFEARLNVPTNAGIVFDDLEFTPEPASLILAAGGALGFRRRRAF